MVEIIGFLGCAYLFIKALELLGRAARYNSPIPWVKRGSLPDEERTASDWEARGHALTVAAALFALISSVGFAIWLIVQASQVQQNVSAATSLADCLRGATTAEDISRCQ